MSAGVDLGNAALKPIYSPSVRVVWDVLYNVDLAIIGSVWWRYRTEEWAQLAIIYLALRLVVIVVDWLALSDSASKLPDSVFTVLEVPFFVALRVTEPIRLVVSVVVGLVLGFVLGGVGVYFGLFVRTFSGYLLNWLDRLESNQALRAWLIAGGTILFIAQFVLQFIGTLHS